MPDETLFKTEPVGQAPTDETLKLPKSEAFITVTNAYYEERLKVEDLNRRIEQIMSDLIEAQKRIKKDTSYDNGDGD
jgi:hypothetical protein